jgi:hypothetical protein
LANHCLSGAVAAYSRHHAASRKLKADQSKNESEEHSMKSKLMTMIWVGALAFGAAVPSAVARSNMSGGNARRPSSLQTSKSAAAKAASKKSSSRAAIPPHTILNGATNNPF